MISTSTRCSWHIFTACAIHILSLSFMHRLCNRSCVSFSKDSQVLVRKTKGRKNSTEKRQEENKISCSSLITSVGEHRWHRSWMYENLNKKSKNSDAKWLRNHDVSQELNFFIKLFLNFVVFMPCFMEIPHCKYYLMVVVSGGLVSEWAQFEMQIFCCRYILSCWVSSKQYKTSSK